MSVCRAANTIVGEGSLYDTKLAEACTLVFA